jgi:hypothetical protein
MASMNGMRTGYWREGRWGMAENYTCVQLSRPAVHDMSISRLKMRTIRALDVKKRGL